MGASDTRSISQLIDELDSAVLWLAGLGVDIGSGRLAVYRKIANEWGALVSGDQKSNVQTLYPRVSTFAYEVPAFLNIYNTFKSVPKDSLASLVKQLSKAVNGSWRIEDETTTGPNPARDFLFEALTAAHVHKPKSNCFAILNAPSDTGFVNERIHTYIECKRLSSTNGIESNLKKACQQLVKAFDHRPRTRNRGLIAIDVSKIIRPPHTILETRTNQEIDAAAGRILSRIVDEYLEEFQHRLHPTDRRIIGLMIYFTSVAVANEDQLFINVSKWTVVRRRNAGPSDLRFLERLPSLLAP